MLTRAKLIEAITHAKRTLCCYDFYNKAFGKLPEHDEPVVCDCKYGPKVLDGTENTGCPEMSLLRAFIQNMTEEEYEAISSRLAARFKQ